MRPDDYKDILLQETREELAKADAKASVLLASSGIAFAALFAVGADDRWYPDNLVDGAARVSAWVAMALTLIGIVAVGAAVKPRLRARHPEAGKPHYFGDVQGYRPAWWRRFDRKKALAAAQGEFAKDLASMCKEPDCSDRLDDQIWTLSHIAYRKYRLISIGMWLYALAAGAALVAFVLEKEWL